ncbi:MAG: protein kinase [Thermoleophilia bacterium]|nr:protein kinase [Thermoleophilia bacterium]
MQLVPGDRFGTYVVESPLGSGGQAAVYRARQVGTERAVALKVFTHVEDAAALARFKREAVAAASVEHPRIVTVYESGDVDGVPFIAMRLVVGLSLGQVVSLDGPIAPHRALAILDDIAEAVDAAHRHNVIHRDIKPANVLLDSEDRAFLTDFGVARLLDQPGMTHRGEWLGTVEYISPEQAAGHAATKASDIYAFGVLAYEVLCGRPPFVHRQPSAVVLAHVRERPPSVTAANPVLPTSLDAPLARALAKDPDARPRQARDLVADLRSALAGWQPPALTPSDAGAEGLTGVLRRFTTGDEGAGGTRVMDAPTRVKGAKPPPPPPGAPVAPRRRRRRGRWAAGGAIVLLAAAAGGAYGGWTYSEDRVHDAEAARGQAYKNGFRNGKAQGTKDGTAKGLKTGLAQGHREGKAQGVAEGRAAGLAEGRQVPDADPGAFRIVRAGQDGQGEYLGDVMSPEGGCFVVDGDGNVQLFQTAVAIDPCSILGRG